MRPLVAAACLVLAAPALARPPALQDLMDEQIEARAAFDPFFASGTLGREADAARMPSFDPQTRIDYQNGMTVRLERAQALDRTGWTEEDQLDADVLIDQLETELAAARFAPEQLPVTAIAGPQYSGPQLWRFQPMRTNQNLRDYVTRLEGWGDYIDGVIFDMRMGVYVGRVPPKIIIEPAVAQARAIAAIDDPRQSPFYGPFQDWPNHPAAQGARAAIADVVTPAYQRFADFLENEYLPECRDSIGASDSSDGLPYYEACIRRYTSLDMTANEIHTIGMAEVERVRGQMMNAIYRSTFKIGDTAEPGGLFAAFVKYLRTSDRFYATSEQDLLDRYALFCKEVDPELAYLFSTLPRLPYGVRPIPAFAAPSSPAAYYYRGSMEQARPGFFMANTYDLRARPLYELRSLTLHEAVPGHHLQGALTQELKDLHPVRRYASYNAYVEGWALYAEKLGYEMGPDPERGFYADPYDEFGHLSYEMWRALRLVVDTGIHAKGWTREQAIDYMLENSALSEANVRAEVDRYIGWPGQALGYKLGELQISAMRERAEEELGEDFDVRAFHAAVLGAGPLPLNALNNRIDRWIEAQQGD